MVPSLSSSSSGPKPSAWSSTSSINRSRSWRFSSVSSRSHRCSTTMRISRRSVSPSIPPTRFKSSLSTSLLWIRSLTSSNASSEIAAGRREPGASSGGGSARSIHVISRSDQAPIARCHPKRPSVAHKHSLRKACAGSASLLPGHLAPFVERNSFRFERIEIRSTLVPGRRGRLTATQRSADGGGKPRLRGAPRMESRLNGPAMVREA